ncbi:hypothetical protein SAMN04489711_1463 [Paracidovorax wautersii]|uniref:Uncharacterized protein n=2 Tax=Paracidovorax wautersii TaxID=1177982 RepID=A0A1I2I0W4_9BURK|nr:hypothetical protein SAMN04489711_1463 [Paracidovorax wautersii]
MWIGSSKGYRMDLIADAYYLFAGQRHQINDPIMRRYESWHQYVDEAEASKDPEARILIKVVASFGHDIPALVGDIRSNEVHAAEDADIILSTGHKGKGLTLDYVRVADDFECLYDAEEELKQFGKLSVASAQEIHLLYVAFTRARFHAELNRETKEWFEGKGIVLPGGGTAS